MSSGSFQALKAVLEGKRVLLTCGPMRTEMDPVRFLQNRSSGKMGLELAKAVARFGGHPVVLLGPVETAMAQQFAEFETQRYVSAAEYLVRLEQIFPSCDFFFSLAAVLDFEIVPMRHKLEREKITSDPKLELALQPVPDIVAKMAAMKQPHQRVIAFAAESGSDEQIVDRAERKRQKKQVESIVANPVRPGLGPEADDNELWVLRDGKPAIHIGPLPKAQLVEPMLAALLL